ncbi:hypothetical protein Pd630_LPD09086 (plasmid) [Rhodococcus opacus PD630]|nr:hypothetical protein Pd630_LPD09086 [Rhodococcus opacus PD630]
MTKHVLVAWGRVVASEENWHVVLRQGSLPLLVFETVRHHLECRRGLPHCCAALSVHRRPSGSGSTD